MPVRSVPFLSNQYYHIFSRGNNKQTIFFQDRDYHRFLDKLIQYRKKYKISLLCFSLLPNHFHLLVHQDSDIPLSAFVGTLLNSHARYCCIKYNLVGHLFQGRFKAKLIEEESYLLQLSRYIHLNNIKSKILEHRFIRKGDRRRLGAELLWELRSYPWSSYRLFFYNNVNELIDKTWLNGRFKSEQDYQKFVESSITMNDILGIETINGLS
ncbi:transposase [Candidatus Gottesmanbacteria bacterium]|nr:transposase [Candidatus Gottesmanbacteria bacterium]